MKSCIPQAKQRSSCCAYCQCRSTCSEKQQGDRRSSPVSFRRCTRGPPTAAVNWRDSFPTFRHQIAADRVARRKKVFLYIGNEKVHAQNCCPSGEGPRKAKMRVQGQRHGQGRTRGRTVISVAAGLLATAVLSTGVYAQSEKSPPPPPLRRL